MTLKCPRCSSIRLKKSGIYSYGNRPNYYCSGCHKYTSKPMPIYATTVEKDDATLIGLNKMAIVGHYRDVPICVTDPLQQGLGEANGIGMVLSLPPRVGSKVLGIEAHPQASFWRLLAVCYREIVFWIGEIKK